jgi:hypothetical protein
MLKSSKLKNFSSQSVSNRREMKFLIIFILCAVFAILMASQSSFSVEFVNATIAICKEQEGASEEDLVNLLNGTLPETRTEKCLAACLAERYGTVI